MVTTTIIYHTVHCGDVRVSLRSFPRRVQCLPTSILENRSNYFTKEGPKTDDEQNARKLSLRAQSHGRTPRSSPERTASASPPRFRVHNTIPTVDSRLHSRLSVRPDVGPSLPQYLNPHPLQPDLMPKPGHIQLIVKQLVYPLRFVPRHGYHFRHGILREGDRSTSFIVVVETTGAEITSRRRETSCSLST